MRTRREVIQAGAALTAVAASPTTLGAGAAAPAPSATHGEELLSILQQHRRLARLDDALADIELKIVDAYTETKDGWEVMIASLGLRDQVRDPLRDARVPLIRRIWAMPVETFDDVAARAELAWWWFWRYPDPARPQLRLGFWRAPQSPEFRLVHDVLTVAAPVGLDLVPVPDQLQDCYQPATSWSEVVTRAASPEYQAPRMFDGSRHLDYDLEHGYVFQSRSFAEMLIAIRTVGALG